MYSLVSRQHLAPRTPIAFTRDLLVPGFWAIDLETKGVDASYPETEVVGIGLANDQHCFYIDGSHGWPPGIQDFLLASSFTSFNVMFDGSFLQKFTGRWLNWVGCSFGLFKQLTSEGWSGQSWSLEQLQLNVLGWAGTNKTAMDAALKERGLGKDAMWQLPAEILGPYCASDADAAWQGWHVLVEAAQPFPQLMDYHQRLFMTEVRLLAEQQFRGMRVDQDRLESCRANNEGRIEASMSAFLDHPEVAHHIGSYNQEVEDVWKASEPPRLTKAGEESKNWMKWWERRKKLPIFNPNSKTQLRWLFFDKLGFKPVKYTETGLPSVSKKVLPAFGEPGMMLAEHNMYVKRRGYIARTIEKSARDGLVHPQFNSVGTVTTRLGGSGGLNLQQQPKVVDFMGAFCARPGHKLIQADAEALEPTVLAEFSRDKTLWSLYGPGAKPNDVYLFVAAKMGELGKEIRKFYDPENPTKESIGAAKKQCKNDRAVAKKFHLMGTYKAGPPKIQEDMALEGIKLPLSDVRRMHREYWALWPGVLRFEEQLKDMWEANGGWIPSALGTPICVAHSLLKDINNRFCQTSGHQILQLWIYYTDKLRRERRVEMYPWLVDLHDEMFFEAPEDQAAAAQQVIEDALALTNQELGMDIKIKGPAAIVDDMAAVKCPDDYNDWLEELLADDEDDDE